MFQHIPISNDEIGRETFADDRRIVSFANLFRNGLCNFALTLLFLLIVGCASPMITELRPNSKNPLVIRFQLDRASTPKISERARLALRTCALEEMANENRLQAAGELYKLIKQRRADPDLIYTFSELTYLEGIMQEEDNPRLAAELFTASALYAYIYLFDPRFDQARNPYDPQFRDICMLYNGALEKVLRLIGYNNTFLLDSNQDYILKTVNNDWNITVKIKSDKIKFEDFEQFRFASDYELKGLQSQYLQHGLGVPLIACRKLATKDDPASEYYPNHMALPLTAFLRPNIWVDSNGDQQELHAELEFYDSVETDTTVVEGRAVPLETDLTTPLAYFLSNKVYAIVGTVGVFDPGKLWKNLPGRDRPAVGLYMAQPYDPKKIPVIMVHGLFSSPMTWVEMFNTLRANPDIRDKYQFWFYLYPSGQPFWVSAADMRKDLQKMRETLDPHHQEPALDEIVLVGHSMGGLISMLQTVDSGDEFWKLVSNTPFENIQGDPEVRQAIQNWFFFDSNPSVHKVVTIATPFRGSRYSNGTTRWAMRSVARMPVTITGVLKNFATEQHDVISSNSLLDIENGLDSLSPSSPFFATLLSLPRAPWVRYHNVIGDIKQNYPTFGLKIPEGDGVVRVTSAEVDWAESQIIVPSNHTKVHSHPKAILEVRRVLLENIQFPDNLQTHQSLATNGLYTNDDYNQCQSIPPVQPHESNSPLFDHVSRGEQTGRVPPLLQQQIAVPQNQTRR